jgi:hypothetical protein
VDRLLGTVAALLALVVVLPAIAKIALGIAPALASLLVLLVIAKWLWPRR